MMTTKNTRFVLALSALCLAACGGSQETSAPASAPNGDRKPVVTQATADPAPPPTTQQATTPNDATATAEFANLPAPYASADYARGKRVWRQCSSCHTVASDADHLIGPNLYGLFGRQVGSADGFSYSRAVQEADFVWTPEKLEEWLTSPRNFLPGNNMSFSGVRKPVDRVSVIAYLMLESGWTAE